MFGHASFLAHESGETRKNCARNDLERSLWQRDRGIVEVFAEEALGEGLRSSPVFGSVKACAVSDQSSLKLLAWAEIQTWRMGVLGVMTNLEEPFSKMMFMTPLLSSNSKVPSSSSAAMSDCLRDSRARSDSRRKVGFVDHGSSLAGLVLRIPRRVRPGRRRVRGGRESLRGPRAKAMVPVQVDDVDGGEGESPAGFGCVVGN